MYNNVSSKMVSYFLLFCGWGGGKTSLISVLMLNSSLLLFPILYIKKQIGVVKCSRNNMIHSSHKRLISNPLSCMLLLINCLHVMVTWKNMYNLGTIQKFYFTFYFNNLNVKQKLFIACKFFAWNIDSRCNINIHILLSCSCMVITQSFIIHIPLSISS